MSDSENDPLRGLLSQFALGPAWARGAGDKQDRKPKSHSGEDNRPPRRDDRDRNDRGREGGERRNFQSRDRNFDDRRNGPPQRVEAGPADGVRVTIIPDAQAVHLIGKEVHQVARVYPLFDIAQTLLTERARCRAIFETDEPRTLFLGKLEQCLFLTREEAIRHLWQSEKRSELIEEETIEVDPPTGNFQSVARCGISGEWLGPPNFHAYQTNLRRLHRERFPNMPFESYASKVRTERGEEAVNAWLETMKQKKRWRLKGTEDAPWIEDLVEAQRALVTGCFDTAFTETRKAEISAAVPAKNLSPSLLTSLKIAGGHARKHPALLIPAVCRAIEAEHLPVFKRQGKLHTGPARPSALAADAILAERPGIMVKWIRDNKPAKLAGLWQAVLPEGSTAPPSEYAADLFWLLQQGHILLFTDDTLVVQEQREPAPPAKKKEPKKPNPPKKAATPAAEAVSEESSAPPIIPPDSAALPSPEPMDTPENPVDGPSGPETEVEKITSFLDDDLDDDIAITHDLLTEEIPVSAVEETATAEDSSAPESEDSPPAEKKEEAN